MAKRLATIPLSAVVIAAFAMFGGPALVQADDGCLREAMPHLSNQACVAPSVATGAAQKNATSAELRGESADPAAQSPAVLKLLNRHRLGSGCDPVRSNEQLSAAAARHSNDVLVSGVTGHVGSDGSLPGARVAASGYAPVALWGEVVFWGTGGAATPETAVDAWMNSPGHREIITNCRFVDIGVRTATANGKMTAVAVFARH